MEEKKARRLFTPERKFEILKDIETFKTVKGAGGSGPIRRPLKRKRRSMPPRRRIPILGIGGFRESYRRIYQQGLLAQGILPPSQGKPELRVDRGSPNTSWVTKEFFEIMGAALSHARARRPTDNAITERFHGTIKQEENHLV